MTPKTDLFELIKSLSKNEKGYFKRFCLRQGGEKKYILLFDYIEQQKEYNEADVLKAFRKENFVKNFSVAKSYLYDTVLESLHNYHADVSTEATLNRMFHYLEILYNKGLYKQCDELLKKIIKIAQATEKHYYIAYYHKWRLKLIATNGFKNNVYSDLTSLFESIENALNTYNSIIKLGSMGHELSFIIGKQGKAADKEIADEVSRIITKADELKNYLGESTLFRVYYQFIYLYYYFYVKKDLEASFKCVKDSITIFQENKKLIREELITYIILQGNMLVIAGRTTHHKEFYDSLFHLRNLLKTESNHLNPKQKSSIFEQTYIAELSFYMRNSLFNKVDDLIDEIKKGLEEHAASASVIHNYILFANIGTMYYCNNNLKESLKWFNKLINYEDIKIRPDIIGIAKTLSVIIHFELGNNDILNSRIRSTKRFLNEYKVLTEIEIKILDYIFNVSKKQLSAGELKNITDKCIEEVEVLVDKTEPYTYFNYIAWLKSKIEKNTYAEALKKMEREKAKK